MNNANTIFLLLTFLLFTVIFGFGIFTDGMFFDGIIYATVANNYANGLGSFWNLYSGNTISSAYHDQPPLTFFIQAHFFKLLGDSIYVERTYDFVFAVIHLLLIKYLWQELTHKHNRFYWLPMLLWISIPLCSWTFKNNLIEVTMGAFDLAAVLFLLKGCMQDKLLLLLAGSFFILLASLSKGIQGLFPIMVPVFYWLICRRTSAKDLAFKFIITLSIPALAYIYFYFTPEINQSIGRYFERRIVGTFNHLQDTKENHLYLFFKLLLELLAPLFLILITWFMVRKRTFQYSIDVKSVYLLLLIGLSASLPLMVTLEQRAFYLTTSLPYFATGLALIALPFVKEIISRIKDRSYVLLNRLLITAILLSFIFVSLNAKNPKRDHDLLSDLYLLQKHLPRGITISIPSELDTKWAYRAYFMRYCYVNLDANTANKYLLMEKPDAPDDACYQNLNLPLKKFSVYYCSSK